MLFTAITRSRCWVNICGIGEKMKKIKKEIDLVREKNYQLDFIFPSDLEKRRKLHGELSVEKRREKTEQIKNLKSIVVSLNEGKLSPEDLPEETLKRLKKLLGD